MVKGTPTIITIKDNDTGAYLLLPVTPPTLQYADGNKKADTVDILNLGNVEIPTGVELDALSWASFFPARYDPGYCATSALLTPIDYRNQFSTWKDAGTSLQIIVPAAGLNKTMYLASFPWDFGKGHEGEIYYQVTFRELKTIRPKKLTPEGTVPPKGKAVPEERPAAPAAAKPNTYTVKSGDSLTKIAKAQGINPWRTIYDKNKGVIGANPNVLRAGQVLKL